MKKKLFGAVGAVLAASLLFAAPASASTKSNTCYGADGGYRATMTVSYTVVSGKVQIQSVNEKFEHRSLGFWNNQDWASKETRSIMNAGNTYQTNSTNPTASVTYFYANQPFFTPNGLKVVMSASGTTSFSGCTVNLP